MAGSTLGQLFSIKTFGESHGPYIGVVIDGVRPGLELDVEAIQRDLNRRRPGQSNITTPRDEKDQVMVVSGVFEGKTTGTPICLLIKNEDQRSKDYSNIKEIFRPGHASYTFLKKYGIFDYRGGGRSSGRETATRVAAGAVAKQILAQYGIEIFGFTRQVGNVIGKKIDKGFIERNPVRAADPDIATEMENLIKRISEEGDSIGGIVELQIQHVPAGLGDPVFKKLDAELAGAMMSIGAVKGVEFGSGFNSATLKGSENNDPFTVKENGAIGTISNNAGGILGGISNGEPIILRIAVKAPSSISKPQQSVSHSGEVVEFSVEGRHDPCICPRVVPVAEAMAALVILDLMLIQKQIKSVGNNLDQLRQEVDLIDTQILLLLKSRQDVVKQIARQKKEKQLKVINPEREKEIFHNIKEKASLLELNSEKIEEIWQLIIETSHQTQQNEMVNDE
ncbi:MAG: chorismate synthase [Calditrichia bacterium]